MESGGGDGFDRDSGHGVIVCMVVVMFGFHW